jgi:photosynthetic reaction center H subunit
MTSTGAITSYFDVAQLVLYMFWIFFFGLIYYLIRENHREGYPLDNDRGLLIEGWPKAPAPKTYRLASGREVAVPRGDEIAPPLRAERVHGFAGAPLDPVGNPLNAGVGPGAWTPRPDEADLDHHGEPKIVPLASVPEYGVSEHDPDPRGKPVVDVYGDQAGIVRDLWLDRGEALFRYLEAEVPLGTDAQGPTRRVLIPMPFASVEADRVVVHALLADQYAEVPATKTTGRVTMLEEEQIAAYFGAGTLYAEPKRAEPLL